MRFVAIESPYGSPDDEIVARNVAYAEACLLDCLKRGEAAVVSHLLYTRVLDDRNLAERTLGIEAGLAVAAKAEASVVYTDYGITSGMWKGIKRAREQDRPVEYRQLFSAVQKVGQVEQPRE